MVGVLLCNRCKYCATRKIKCDEQWPTCGNCMRRKRACSGPPGHRFIETKWQRKARSLQGANMTEGSTLAPVSSPRNPQNIRRWNVTVGSFPPSPAESATTRLIGCIISGELFDFDVYLSKQSFELLPRHMLTSQALCDAVDFMAATYTNHRRGLQSRENLDFKSYGRALRSLSKALRSPQERNSTSVLAAVSILDRVATAYDIGCGFKPSTHLQGVHAVMTAQGPPSSEDDLKVSLTLDNFGPLYNESILTGEPSIYSSPEWQGVISAALNSGRIQNEGRAHNYYLSLRACYWASLVEKLLQTRQAKSRTEALMIANNVVEETMIEISHIRVLEELRFTMMRDHGLMVVDLDPTSPFLKTYSFSDPIAAMSVACYAMALIGLSRVAARALAITGLEDPDLELVIVHHSHHIGRCIKYVRDLEPLARCSWIHGLQMAYESSDAKEKQFIIDTLYDFEEYKGLPTGRWTHDRIILFAKMITGRIPPAGSLEDDISYETKVIEG